MRSKTLVCGSVIVILSAALVVCAVPSLKSRLLATVTPSVKQERQTTTAMKREANGTVKVSLSKAEAAREVSSTMAAFARSIAQRSMTPFYRQISPFWQARSSVEELDKKFAPFLRAGVDLRPLAKLHPVIVSMVPLKGKRAVRVIGYYPTRPMRVEFEIALRPEEGRWRAVAFFVGLKPASALKTEAKRD